MTLARFSVLSRTPCSMGVLYGLGSQAGPDSSSSRISSSGREILGITAACIFTLLKNININVLCISLLICCLNMIKMIISWNQK